MEKKTKLITIDFDEYIGLSQIKNNLEMCVLMKLKDELNGFRNIFLNTREITTYEVRNIFDKAINRVEKEIIKLEKVSDVDESTRNN